MELSVAMTFEQRPENMMEQIYSSWEIESQNESGKSTSIFNQVQDDPLGVNLTNFPGGSAVKNPPAMQEMWVQSLGQKDPLENEMATHSSILAWKILWTKEPGRLQSMESQKCHLQLSD